MALIGATGTDNVSAGSLTTTFLNSLISANISKQRLPINTLNTQKDQLSIQKAIYTDLKTKLATLHTTADDLKSNDGNSVFDNKTAISSNSLKLTASVESTAMNGKYTISIATLAKSHRVSSDPQTSSTGALNLDGKFSINGESITIGLTDTLQNIANSINNAEYDAGKGVSASIVNNNLIIEAESTGTDNQIIASDTEGTVLASLGVLNYGDFKTTLQDAKNASFTVNGVGITRSSNTEIDGVIDGVKLNLIGETVDNTMTLTVQQDYTAIRSKVSAFISNFNSTVNYLEEKTKTVANPETKTYTRGALTGNTIFTSLRINLFANLRTSVTAGSEGDPQYLADVGITLGAGLNISIDTSKLDSAVGSNLDGVTKLFSTIMDKFETLLEPFTASSSSSNTLVSL
jgi:flagellar hook-associated protein 2